MTGAVKKDIDKGIEDIQKGVREGIKDIQKGAENVGKTIDREVKRYRRKRNKK